MPLPLVLATARMPAQAPGAPKLGPSPLVSPAKVSSSMDVKPTGSATVPRALRTPLTVISELFATLRVVPCSRVRLEPSAIVRLPGTTTTPSIRLRTVRLASSE
jgi:hypothetical protein